jgi:hypothetical protein
MAKLKEYYDHFCESEYEYAFIGLLEAEGWQYLAGNNIPRPSKRDVMYTDDLSAFLSKTNPDLKEEEIGQLVDNIRLVGAESDFATLHKVYGWMVDGVQYTPQSGIARMVSLIDFENPDNNIFRAVNQLVVSTPTMAREKTADRTFSYISTGCRCASLSLRILRMPMPPFTMHGSRSISVIGEIFRICCTTALWLVYPMA